MHPVTTPPESKTNLHDVGTLAYQRRRQRPYWTNGNSNGLGLCCSGGRRAKKSEGILRVMPRAPAIKYQGILYPHGVEARVKEFLKQIPSVADKGLVRFQGGASAADHSESSMSALFECSEPVFGASQKAVN